ncbi:hypothetical protein [Paractinoplanes atraurantiacus]|uniref:Uncharacterized protein n=1 Tax=Paractinoplanes atraurantiacus TaxID=1036182 RepID=A0A285GQB6_9ACTN|nr:hypothetical protein [Actinoplanes atraurantiacus]SNY25638.1 hypothetical protein SAMN05421748_102379 [Actinoplanes atraurantiacus]
MRTVLACLAAAGAVTVAVGAFLTVGWMILAGTAALLIATVMAALGFYPRRGH